MRGELRRGHGGPSPPSWWPSRRREGIFPRATVSSIIINVVRFVVVSPSLAPSPRASHFWRAVLPCGVRCSRKRCVETALFANGEMDSERSRHLGSLTSTLLTRRYSKPPKSRTWATFPSVGGTLSSIVDVAHDVFALALLRVRVHHNGRAGCSGTCGGTGCWRWCSAGCEPGLPRRGA